MALKITKRFTLSWDISKLRAIPDYQTNERKATCLGCGKIIPRGLGVKVRCNWERTGGPYRGFVHRKDLPDFRFESLKPWSTKYGGRMPGRRRVYASDAERLRAWRARRREVSG